MLPAAARHVLAPTLVLTSSFVHFVRSHDYSLVTPEVLLALLGIAVVGATLGLIIALRPRILGPIVIAGLVVWFADVLLPMDPGSRIRGATSAAIGMTALLIGFVLRAHLDRIVSVAFGTILLSTLLLPVSAASERAPVSSATQPDRLDLPVVVHLILDEHTGLAGIPDDEQGRAVRDRLAAFYRRQGFRVFPRAFSQYFDSRVAISHALNLAETFDETLVRRTSGLFDWHMTRNAYLERMQRRGHRIQVYQPDYMNLCLEGLAAEGRCFTYDSASLKPIERAALPTVAKLRVSVSTYLMTSRLYKKNRDRYRSFRSGRLGRHLRLPEWDWERYRPHAIVAMSAFDLLRSDLSRARPGDFFLAHLLLPHYPYVYDSACQLRTDPGDWLDRSLPERSIGAPNDARSRAERYALYLEQVECVTRKIDEMLVTLRERGVLERAVILVHGDHGSRILTADPIVSNRGRLTASDLIDSFSTLVAVRAPDLKAGSDEHPWSLSELMRHFVTEDFRKVPERRPGRPIADVYLRQDPTESTFLPERLDLFGASSGRDRDS